MKLRSTLALSLVALTGAGIVPLGTEAASAAPAVSRAELKARAIGYMTESMSAFQRHDNQAPQPFDWRDNACSNVPDGIFKKACDRHDFGYRNFGKGLRLDRTEARRKWVDDQFKKDMYKACEDAWGPNSLCRRRADVYYQGVRSQGAGAFFG